MCMKKLISSIGETYFKGGIPMASNYTEKYKLCQWEATDQVLRTDFNEDNQKIEAAFLALREEIINPDIISMMFNTLSADIKDLERRVETLEQA